MTVTINGAGTITGLTSADVPQVNVTTKLLVGGPTTSANARGIQAYGSAGTQNILQWNFSATTNGSDILLVKTRGTTATATTAVESGDTLGTLSFAGADGTTGNVSRAAITGFVDGAVLSSPSTVPTAISFTTGTTVGAERMRITSAGLMGIGTGTPASCAIVDVTSTTKGFKFPVMTGTEKTNIAAPVAGLVVFDSTALKLCVYDGTAWRTITSV